MRQKQEDPRQRQADPIPTGGGGSRWSFRNWRVPTRLTAIVLVPVVTGLTFAGLRVHDQLALANTASQNEQIAILVRDSTTVGDDLENERDLAVAPQLAGIQNDPPVLAARQKTDADLATLNAQAKMVKSDDRITTELGAFNAALSKPVGGLAQLRANGNSQNLNPIATQQAYSALFFPLLGLDNELSFGNNNINSRGRELYALSLEKASTSTERNLVTTALVSDKMPPQLAIGIQVANKLTSTALGQFLVAGIPSDLALYNKSVVGQGLDPSEGALIAMIGKPSLKPSGITIESWFKTASTGIAQQRMVEQTITDQIVADAHAAKNSATQQAMSVAAEALALVLFAGILAYLMGRSMVRGMRKLRDSAQEIAAERLPDLVRKLSKTDPERVDTTVRPIPLTGRDEMGEVARAFDDVHREAIRLASEQALLRGNVNAIFTNLSRRSQGLIERQLGLITDLENNEADPDQLENLFKLDHLATRMRRNGENLLVLAGESAGREWTDPIPLVDVLRAAASEVEQYERIELSGIPETDVIGPAVTDLVHLLAELLENATTFSSPQTRVRVTATRLPDMRVLIEIHDKGIGLTAEDFAGINSKLADPPTVDASVSRQMGLFVVGRLAERHGIRVQLRPSGESAGTTSLVMVPDHLTQLPRPADHDEQFTVSRIYGEAEQGAFATPGHARSASELGFDDSRYDRQLTGEGAAAAARDGLHRSPRLEQRRGSHAAALGVGPQGHRQEPVQPMQAYTEDYGNSQGPGYEPEPTPDYGADFDRSFGAPYNAYQAPAQATGPAAPAEAYRGDYSDYSAPSYNGPGTSYEGGQYSAADFESTAGYQAAPSYGQEPQEPYRGSPYSQPFYPQAPQAQSAPAPTAEQPVVSQPYSPAFPAPATPALPQRPTGAPKPGPGSNGANGSGGSLSGSLPQRRPGQALGGGRAIGDREAGERPNWFTGAREDEVPDSPSPAPFTPSAPAATVTTAAQAAAEPLAGGTTSAGLPRRVPRQNLLPGNVPDGNGTQQTAAAPQLSRSPEEVRGRLTNLRRGIQQGHSVGDTPSPDQHGSTDLFGGPNHSER